MPILFCDSEVVQCLAPGEFVRRTYRQSEGRSTGENALAVGHSGKEYRVLGPRRPSSHHSRGSTWEIKYLAYKAGFSNFKYWIKDENKKIPNEFDSTNSNHFYQQYLGKIKQWNASLKKPF